MKNQSGQALTELIICIPIIILSICALEWIGRVGITKDQFINYHRYKTWSQGRGHAVKNFNMKKTKISYSSQKLHPTHYYLSYPFRQGSPVYPNHAKIEFNHSDHRSWSSEMVRNSKKAEINVSHHVNHTDQANQNNLRRTAIGIGLTGLIF